MPANFVKKAFVVFIAIACSELSNAQFVPVPITGFNQDVVAETGTSSLTTTTMPLDGATSSNKVMYTNTFRTTNALGGGGIPDNGLITDAAGSYQLAPYNGNNVLLLQRGQNGDLTLTTPAKFSKIRVLVFSTEGNSLVNGTLFFTDGSTAPAVTNYTVNDWFNGTTNLVMSGFGRAVRATPTGPADAYPANPRYYYIEIVLSCANQQKTLQKINFANATTAGTNAPYPNLVLWALSGVSYSQTVNSFITPATCAGNGSAVLTVTGSTSPYSFSWNTVPVQTGSTATNLAPGNYIATITDAGACASTFPVTIPFQNNLAMTVSKVDASCTASGTIIISASGGAGYQYSINGGASFQSSNTFSNLAPGTYNVVTRTAANPACTTSQTIIVALINNLTISSQSPVSLCQGATFTPNFTSTGTSFSWSPATGVSNPSILNPTFTAGIPTTYTLTATLGTCTGTQSFTLNAFPGVTVNAGPDTLILAGDSYPMQASGSNGTYLWDPATGLSATNILNPVASPVISTNYRLRITNAQGCTAFDDVIISVIPYCVKVMEAFTPNGDGINDLWTVTNGNCITRVQARIYNRYGALVFQSNDYKNDWNGMYEGKHLPDGTYYYIVHTTLINGRPVVLKGNVTILR